MMDDLKGEFEPNKVSWRSKTLTKNGDKALALAYIDARDVMDRLDNTVGPLNWKNSYQETGSGRVICTLSIRLNEKSEWISKSDGAGSTAIEGEKGGLSDAFKRAAVMWGIGRYLYDLDAPWVPCKSYERNGKFIFSHFTADPWDHINRDKNTDIQSIFNRLKNAALSKENSKELVSWCDVESVKSARKKLPAQLADDLTRIIAGHAQSFKRQGVA